VENYRTRVMTGTQVVSRGDVCPQLATSGARIQQHVFDLYKSRTGVFGAGSRTNHLAFAATQHREAPD
jgi:hypothetical protein